MKIVAIIMFLGIVGRLSAGEPNGSLAFVDEYLASWDKFAQGQKELVPYLRDNKKKFEGELSARLHAGDKKAVSRVVFYAVVQVGGFIDVDSELGREATRVFGKLPLTQGKNGEQVIFAGDIFFWWQVRKKDFPAFPLYLEWERREFTQNVVLRLYRNARENQKKKG